MVMNNKYAKAYKEVLEIIKYFPENEYNKIPKDTIEYYRNNMDKNYEFTINPEVDLSKQNISKEANAIIVKLFQDYFATEEQKIKIKEILKINDIKEEHEKKEKYNPDNLFKKPIKSEKIDKESGNMGLVEYKENFFTKFKKFVLKLLHVNS